MSTDNATTMSTYFESWKSGDVARLRSILADDVVFDGPLAHVEGGDECASSIQGLSRITADIVIQKMVVDGPDVITWFELHTTVAAPTPVANWSQLRDGKIGRIRVTFDPRELVAAGG
jgi:SnoaL-like domain